MRQQSLFGSIAGGRAGDDPSERPVRQRRELTFRHNAGLGRHGWLRLTPAYSVRVVDEILDREQVEARVLDPFSGTGTTALAAACRGLDAVATDINPFLIWFGRTKTRRYSSAQIGRAGAAVEAMLVAVRDGIEPAEPPPLKHIERWWTRERLDLLCRLMSARSAVTREGTAARDLVDVCFCRAMIALSNAAFNHQSMSFATPKGTPAVTRHETVEELLRAFVDAADRVLAAARDNPRARAEIVHDDARHLDTLAPASFDVVVTSPPYPNRMSYIRELRPYMYWLGYLREAREAGELDWGAIGGTWGVATSRVARWERGAQFQPGSLASAVERVRKSEAPNAELLARYVAKYFADIWEHLVAVAERIARGGRVHYIVGNSTFYGVLIETERVYAEMLAELGFGGVKPVILRKRNSKKELFEFDVCAERA